MISESNALLSLQVVLSQNQLVHSIYLLDFCETWQREHFVLHGLHEDIQLVHGRLDHRMPIVFEALLVIRPVYVEPIKISPIFIAQIRPISIPILQALLEVLLFDLLA